MTPFTTIYSKAIRLIGDYKIAELANQDYDSFLEYMRSLLDNSIIEFEGSCLNSLTVVTENETDKNGQPITVYYFEKDLSKEEIKILYKTIILQWWEQKLQDVTVFEGLPTRDFNKIKVDTMFKQKSEYRDKLMEEIDRDTNKYYANNLSALPFFGDL